MISSAQHTRGQQTGLHYVHPVISFSLWFAKVFVQIQPEGGKNSCMGGAWEIQGRDWIEEDGGIQCNTFDFTLVLLDGNIFVVPSCRIMEVLKNRRRIFAHFPNHLCLICHRWWFHDFMSLVSSWKTGVLLKCQILSSPLDVTLAAVKDWKNAGACNWEDAESSSCSKPESRTNESCGWEQSYWESCKDISTGPADHHHWPASQALSQSL